jgi:hypothetical protein
MRALHPQPRTLHKAPRGRWRCAVHRYTADWRMRPAAISFVRSFADLIAQHGWCHCAAEIPRNAMGKVNKKELVQLFV